MIFFLLLFSLSASAQVIESRAVALKGTSLPGTCVVGERFVKTDAPRALQLHICTATNTWSPVGYLVAGASGALIVDTGVYPHTVDVDTAIVCRTTASCTPTGAQNFSGSSATRPTKEAAADPGTCTEGEMLYNTTTKATKRCTATNTWTTIGGGSSFSIGTTGLGYECIGPTCQMQNQASTFTAKTPRYVQWVLRQPMTVTKMGFLPSTADSTSCGGVGNCGLAAAIYDSACDKIAGTDFTTRTGLNTTSGLLISHGSSFTLQPGIYFLGFATDSTTLRITGSVDNTGTNILLNLSSGNRYFNGATLATGDGSGLTMPSSCGTKSVINNINEVFIALP